MFFGVIYYFGKLCHFSKDKYIDYEAVHKLLNEACKKAIKKGRVTLDVSGYENIPKEDGFVFYPNHQGLFDVLVFFATCEKSFGFVMKKEAADIILVKQIRKATGSFVMDRKDLRQSVQIINNMTEGVKNGRNYIIFAEGTRSKEGNKLLNFKGGSFKAATNAKCPIVPCALIDAYRPFDEKGIKPVTVKLRYLKPILFEEYKDMKGTEIAEMVKNRIEEAIKEELNRG